MTQKTNTTPAEIADMVGDIKCTIDDNKAEWVLMTPCCKNSCLACDKCAGEFLAWQARTGHMEDICLSCRTTFKRKDEILERL